MSMLSYLQENMYMVKGHIVYFHCCNDVEKISVWIFFLKVWKIYAIYTCRSTILWMDWGHSVCFWSPYFRRSIVIKGRKRSSCHLNENNKTDAAPAEAPTSDIMLTWTVLLPSWDPYCLLNKSLRFHLHWASQITTQPVLIKKTTHNNTQKQVKKPGSNVKMAGK